MNALPATTEERDFADFASMIASEQRITCAYETVCELAKRLIDAVHRGALTWFAARVRLIAEIEREIESMPRPASAFR
ncbi:hypothetical protein [Noviherbaspirillum galbum]|uniref:Uncharacterized protein n=1 Tax=Noviherbaspirillum galbum TaxID=2709383 RepID=A0A6B3SGQ0_9BURK|nr:hypothetical protein [Noviherbaspirillum galbum]NEX60057.1 hypothetical protein [Noviherbaspirillum galbum]